MSGRLKGPCKPGCPALVDGGGRCPEHRGKVTVVCGLPATGKSTYVAEHKARGDIVWDFDVFMTALLGLPSRERPDECIAVVLEMRDALVRRLRLVPVERASWIIVTKEDLACEIAGKLGGQVVILETPEPERQDRIAAETGIDGGGQVNAPTAAIKRPVLRYFGGKWRIAPWVISHFPPHTCYVEPFGGGGSVLLRKEPSPIEVFNDLDREVVHFFRTLRERGDELIRMIALTPYARDELELTYEPVDDPIERARRMFVRSWQGRGGARNQWKAGWRYQRSDAQRKSSVRDWDEWERLYDVVARLKQIQIERQAATKIIDVYDTPDTLFYCDPPYTAESRAQRWARHAYAHEMTDGDHRALAERLQAVRGMVVISGYPSPLYDEMYGGWERRTMTTLGEGGQHTRRLYGCRRGRPPDRDS